MMNVIISDKTVFRIQKLIEKPISRGFDQAISQILDDYESVISQKRRVHL